MAESSSAPPLVFDIVFVSMRVSMEVQYCSSVATLTRPPLSMFEQYINDLFMKVAACSSRSGTLLQGAAGFSADLTTRFLHVVWRSSHTLWSTRAARRRLQVSCVSARVRATLCCHSMAGTCFQERARRPWMLTSLPLQPGLSTNCGKIKDKQEHTKGRVKDRRANAHCTEGARRDPTSTESADQERGDHALSRKQLGS